MKITVRFLGKPEIIRDGVRVAIPQKKIQALLLYLLFNESCSRDEAGIPVLGGAKGGECQAESEKQSV